LVWRLLFGAERGGAVRTAVEPGIDAAVGAEAGATIARRLVAPAGRSALWPFEVFGGRSNAASRFSSSAMRTSADCNCPTNGSATG
jgi:hypothetical protein